MSINILNTKQEILQETTVADLCHMLEDTRGLVSTSLAQIKKEKEELQALSGESREIIIHLLRKSQAEKNQYLNDVKWFQINRNKLNEQAGHLRSALDLAALDQRIAKAHANMLDNWTTRGLKDEMRGLFNDFRDRMQLVVEHSDPVDKVTIIPRGVSLGSTMFLPKKNRHFQ